MGFFSSGSGAKKDGLPSLDLLHRLQCKICPLDKVKNRNPHIKPKGASEPLIYMLGEAPGAQEDSEARHFVGKSGQLLRARLPEEVLPFLRWNNVVRTRPPENRNPEKMEIECCRPSIELDIAQSKPRAIFGFGNIALQWATGQNGIAKWRGRRLPVQIGGHSAWFYPMYHPASLLRMGRRVHREMAPDEIGSEEERVFTFDLARALEEVENLPEPRVWSRADAEQGLELLTHFDQVEAALKWAAMQQVVGMDYETFRMRPYASDAQILSVAIGTERRSFAFAFDHPGQKWTKFQRQRLDALWREFLLSKARKAVHNLPFEQEWSAVFYGADVLRGGPWECTYQQAACLDDRIGSSETNDDRYRRGGGSLDFLVQQHFGFGLKALSPLNKKDLRQEPLMDLLRYNGMDGKFHYLLWREQDRLLTEQGLQAVYRANLRRCPTLVLTQIVGVPVDQAENKRLDKKYRDRIADCEYQIEDFDAVQLFEKRYKTKYRPSSNPDTIKLLRDVMEFRELEKENGGYSVDEEAISKIDHPIIPLIIQHRKASKQLSTYIEPYADHGERSTVWPDGLLHPIINPFGTLSNRTSSEYPNVQNQQKRDPEAKEIRRQIVAPPGHVLVPIDYGQIQARGIAMASLDKVFVKALWDRYDIHTEWAERISRAYPERVGGRKGFSDKKVMKAFRGDVKNQWTFPLFFGARMESVAEYLQIPTNVMSPLYDEFWEIFHGVKDWQDRLLAEYEESGIVRHLDGRLNRAPLSPNQIFNLPIQGVESQIVLNAMNKLSEKATNTGDIYYQPMLEIHDDLTFCLPENKVEGYVQEIVADMLAIDFDFINVPLTVEVSLGSNLLDVEDIFDASSDTWKK